MLKSIKNQILSFLVLFVMVSFTTSCNERIDKDDLLKIVKKEGRGDKEGKCDKDKCGKDKKCDKGREGKGNRNNEKDSTRRG